MSVDTSTFDIASLSRAGGRPENEDYADFLQTPAVSCWVLADGLGGHRGGATASKAVVEAALASFRDRPDATAEAVQAHIAQAQSALVALQAANPALAQMRSTIVVLVSTGRDAVWGHVGDSRLYHLRGGQVVARTRDHSVSQALVDGGQIDPHDQGAHEDRSRLLRCLGKDFAEAGATISGPHALARGDAFLLCTDGFWEVLDPVEMALDYAGADDTSAWLERMEARLRRREGPVRDNYTATAIRLTLDGVPAAPPHDPRQPVRVTWRDEEDARPSDATEMHTLGTWRRATWIAATVIALLFLSGVGVGIWRREAVSTWITRWWTPTPAANTDRPLEDQRPLALTPPGADVKPPERATPAPAGAEGSDKGGEAVKEGGPGKSEPPKANELAKPDETAKPAETTKPAEPAKPGDPAKETFAGPSALPEKVVFRPAAGLRYASLQAAIKAASPDETIWIGPGELKETIAPIAMSLTLKGAGRDVTRLSFTGKRGLVLTGATGGVEDLELCCATSDAVLEIGGTFRGTIARARIVKGEGWGILIRGSAAPTIAGTLVEDNRKGRINVQERATLTWQ